MHEAGELRVVVSHRLPLHRAAEAHRILETGHSRGKIVLVVGDGPVDVVTRTVGAWSGVTISEGRFASTAFHLGRRELGHLHAGAGGGGVADLPFPRRVRDELIGAGRARPHHALPDSGWVSAPLRDAAGAEGVIALFAAAYERARAAAERRGSVPSAV